jgi:RND family efflux transporter MFP subunit
MSRRAKRTAFIAGLIAVIVIAATAIAVQQSPHKSKTPAEGKAPPQEPGAVRVVAPTKDPGTPELELPAIAEPYAETPLYARINGFVSQRRAELGDRVSAGQVLATIDAPELQHAYERAKAAQAQAQARVELSQSNLDRTTQLVEQGFLSRASLDERNADVRVALADRDAAAAEAKRLGELLNYRTVRAPFAGVITERKVERGNLVAADQPQADAYLYRIARIDRLRVAIDVPQSAAATIAVGMPVKVTFPEFPGQTFQGEIARTATAIDPRSGTMRVEIALPNPGNKIPAGMAGQVVLSSQGSSARYLLPVNALLTGQEGTRVALVQDGAVRFVPVRAGRNLGQNVEILAGVDENSRVILSPNALLREGDRVTVAEAAKPAESK